MPEPLDPALAALQRLHRPIGPLPLDTVAALRRSVEANAEDWVAASLVAKGWQHLPHAHAEEWASGPLPVARFLVRLQQFVDREATQVAPEPGRTADGDTVLAAHRLRGIGDRLTLQPYRTTVHVARDQEHRRVVADGKRALVLGAGNVTATPILDVLEHTVARGRAVVCKLAPPHATLLPVFERALAPLVQAGRLVFCTGDGELGQRLAHHPDIDAIHLTGATSTWRTLRDDASLAAKERTAEVGCCSPVLVLPGVWSQRELRAAAESLAAYVAMNGGATCVAPRVLLTAAAWPQRDAFLRHVRAALAALPARVPFHPGVRAAFAAASMQEPTAAALAPTLCAGRSLHDAPFLCGREWFAPVANEWTLPGDSLTQWLDAATDFVRAHCFGALSAYVFAPASELQRDQATIDRAVHRLPHGTIATNTWTGLGYGLGNTPWGVREGTASDCGVGFARNLDGWPVVRTLVQAPLPAWPRSPWLPSHAHGTAALRALTRLTLRPTFPRLFTTTWHALRS